VDRWQAELQAHAAAGIKWRPQGTPVDGYARLALAAAAECGWSVQDLLCTATHWIAELAAQAIETRLPALPKVDEIVVTGGGQHNGLLMGELTQRIGSVPLVRETDLGMPESARDAAVAAVLALLHLDQIAACPTAITGARTPRVLGSLTPGSPQAWQRLLREMTSQAHAVVSLRSAM
jgi:anhydro-N-acetylmuramic acid kinase